MDLINRQMAKGVAWMILFKFMNRGLGLISTLILARLLVPADFGLVAMAMSLIAVIELLGAFGFDIVLIHKQDAEPVHYNTAWTFNVLVSAATALVLVALAGPAASFYDEPRLTVIIWLMAAGLFIEGFQNIGIVDFRKKLQFEKDFYFGLYKKLAGFCVTVPLAFIWGNYWALIAGMLSGRIGGVVLGYLMHPFRPRPTLAASAELFNFSKWLLFNNLISFFMRRSADFIIGKMSGPRALGLYTISYEISNLPTTELVAPINRAVYPGYAKMAGDLRVLRQGYINVLAVIALLALPAGFGIAAVAEPLVMVFLGDKWGDAVSIIAILAVYGSTNALMTNSGSVYNALGKPHYITFQGAAKVTVLLPLLFFLTHRYGVLGAAWAFLAESLLFMPVTHAITIWILKMPVRQLTDTLWRPAIATGIMYLAVTHVLQALPPAQAIGGQIAHLAAGTATGAVVYIAVIVSLWLAAGRPDGAEQFVLDKTAPRMRFARKSR